MSTQSTEPAPDDSPAQCLLLRFQRISLFLAAITLLTLMNGCGGGGGGGGGTAPETPWNVSASLVDGGVSVSWTGVNNATAYHVYYSRTPDSGTTGTRFTPTHPELQPHTIVTGLENYKTYYFVVTASNKHGESAPSSEVSAIPSERITAETLQNKFDPNLQECLAGHDMGFFTTIYELTCSEKNITNLSGMENYLLGLETLKITESAEEPSTLADLTPLASLPSLRSITLNHQNISNLSPLGALPHLQGLNISYNKVNSLQPITDLTTLTALELRNNEIPSIPSLANMTSLMSVTLPHNQMSDISGVGGLTAIIYLDLSYNNIADISALAGLSTLKGLDLPGNLIIKEQLPHLANLSQLEFLYLDKNRIDDFSGLAAITSLKMLDLGDQDDGFKITAIPENIGNLTSLEQLGLRYNSISDLQNLSALSNSLRDLVLRGNAISDISPLTSLTNLVWLELESNQIDTGVGSLVELTNIQMIKLDNNPGMSCSELETLIELFGDRVSPSHVDPDTTCTSP